MKKFITLPLAVIVITAIILSGCGSSQKMSSLLSYVTEVSVTSTPTVIGNPASDFTFQTPDGEEETLSNLRGRSVLLNFWKVDCTECIAEMPDIQEISEDWGPKGLEVLTVNVGDPPEKVEELLNNHEYSFPVVIDAQKKVAGAYNARMVPLTYLIDEDGILSYFKAGRLNKNEIESEILTLLANPEQIPEENAENKNTPSDNGNETTSPEPVPVPENHAPELQPVEDKTAVQGELFEFRIQASDPDGDVILYNAIGLPEGASLDTSTGHFSWLPEDTGVFDMWCTASDGKVTVFEKIKINVIAASPAPTPSAPNHAPEFETLSQTINAYEGNTINLTLTASDEDGDSLSYTAIGLPERALLDSTTGKFYWRTAWPIGKYSIDFIVSDGKQTDIVTVNLVVERFPQAAPPPPEPTPTPTPTTPPPTEEPCPTTPDGGGG